MVAVKSTPKETSIPLPRHLNNGQFAQYVRRNGLAKTELEELLLKRLEYFTRKD